MLVLAYCAGLRLGEIVRLNVSDFDVDDGTIEIRLSKFFKSRRLPLSDSVVAALRSYLDARNQAGAPTSPDAALFWHMQAAGRYSSREGREHADRCSAACETQTRAGTWRSPHSRSETCLRREPYAYLVQRGH